MVNFDTSRGPIFEDLRISPRGDRGSYIFRKDNLVVQLDCSLQGREIDVNSVRVSELEGTQEERGILEYKSSRPKSFKLNTETELLAQLNGENRNFAFDFLRETARAALIRGGDQGIALFEKVLREKFIGFESSLSAPMLGVQNLNFESLPDHNTEFMKGLSSGNKDKLTGLDTRYALFSHKSVKAINREVEGEKYIATWDISHVRVANDRGLAREVDQYLKSFSAVAESTFKPLGISYKLIRLGGDEFAVVLSGAEREKILYALNSFRVSLELQRQFLLRLNGDTIRDERVGSAHRDANERQAAREIEDEYKRLCGGKKHFSKSGYRAFLLEKLKEHPENTEELLNRSNKELLVLLARLRSKDTTETLLSNAFSDLVSIKENPKSNIYQKALAQADRSAMHRKVDPDLPLEIVELDTKIKERDATKRARLRVNKVERRIKNQLRELHRKNLTHEDVSSIERFVETQGLMLDYATDPTVNSHVQRHNIRADSKIRSLKGLNQASNLLALKVDIDGAGVFNHLENPDRLDEILAEMGEIVSHSFGRPCVIRSGGGALWVLLDDAKLKRDYKTMGRLAAKFPLDREMAETDILGWEKRSLEDDLNTLLTRLRRVMKYAVTEETRAAGTAEYESQHQLSLARLGDRAKPLGEYGRISLSLAELKINDPEMSLNELFEKLRSVPMREIKIEEAA